MRAVGVGTAGLSNNKTGFRKAISSKLQVFFSVFEVMGLYNLLYNRVTYILNHNPSHNMLYNRVT